MTTISTISTISVNNRPDWYQALAIVAGRRYFAFESTRHAAFMAVARELANAGHLPW